MERMPQPQEELESGFDREAVAVEAAMTARKMLTEEIDSSLEGEDRFGAIVDLMNELAEDNGNRFIVEALAQRLTNEKLVYKQREYLEMFPYAANDDEYDYQQVA